MPGLRFSPYEIDSGDPTLNRERSELEARGLSRPSALTQAQVASTQGQVASTQGQVASRTVRLPLSLVFAPVAERLTLEMKNRLRILALHLRRDDDSRVELQGYASTPDGNATQARHVALSQAMAVRAYLIDQDVDLDQIDVRALGERVESGSADRVDIVAAARRG